MNIESLTAKNIQKIYTTGAATISLFRGFSYIFKRGNTYALMGPSGVGKSTLLHMLAGFETPSAGSVSINARDLSTLSLDEKNKIRSTSLGFIFQQPYLIPELSILENVMIKGLIAGLPHSVCKNKALSILKEVGLEQYNNHYPSELSGGQQQRVACARALVSNPDFICADEPTGSLDKKTARQIVDLLCTYQKKNNMGLIISTHDEMVAACLHYTLKINNGLFSEIKNEGKQDNPIKKEEHIQWQQETQLYERQ
ncbi:MAG: ABC transporter ATP-binding protein [Candidatus Babeliales bacterium]